MGCYLHFLDNAVEIHNSEDIFQLSHTGIVKFSILFTLLTGPGMAEVRPPLSLLLLYLEAVSFYVPPLSHGLSII